METHLVVGDKVENIKNGKTGIVSRVRVLGMALCCGVEVTWDDPILIKKIFQKDEINQLKKL